MIDAVQARSMLMVLKLRFSPFPGLTLGERDSQIPAATAPLSTTMAEAASPQPAEHNSMELMDSAVDGTALDAAAAAAAAVLAIKLVRLPSNSHQTPIKLPSNSRQTPVRLTVPMQRANSPTTRARNAASSKQYRARKKAGTAGHQRSAAEKAALLARPYSELSDKEKELVRYYRKAAKREAQRAAAAAGAAAAPPSSAHSPAPPPSPAPLLQGDAFGIAASASSQTFDAAFAALAAAAAFKLPAAAAAAASLPAADSMLLEAESDAVSDHHSLLLNTADMKDILGRSPSPAVPARSSPLLSSPLLDAPHPPIPAASPTPAATAAAVPFLFLPAVTRKRKGKNMNTLHPNSKRVARAEQGPIQILNTPEPEEKANNEDNKENKEEQPTAAAAASATAATARTMCSAGKLRSSRPKQHVPPDLASASKPSPSRTAYFREFKQRKAEPLRELEKAEATRRGNACQRCGLRRTHENRAFFHWAHKKGSERAAHPEREMISQLISNGVQAWRLEKEFQYVWLQCSVCHLAAPNWDGTSGIS
jgi:hypothetical protein